MIGQSVAWQKVRSRIERVGPTDATVLIQGETGTGKELIARALHATSERRRGPLVRLNVAAIPVNLLESELFGHERGAFTGALARRLGRFEEANGGSLFLDEIGELDLELQPKLLRVLEQREVQRLGGIQTFACNVRLIVATNRDLTAMVRAGRFRSDLYYRLNVVPIHAPPLRERREDIPPLVEHFLDELAGELGRRPPPVSPATLEKLTRHPWPGNVRELRNVLERALVLMTSDELEIDLERQALPQHRPSSGCDELSSVARAHILRVLEDCGWVIAGPKGAAARLGMKRTTLNARLKKMGIQRQAAEPG
jgi:transcriptional regulator with GAF, ATPase, and Fis domain